MFEIVVVALLIGASCALAGSFLVIQGESLMSDAISHALLSGMVIIYLITGAFSFPLLVIGGFLAALCAVIMIDYLRFSARVKQDVSIGVVFPFLFSLGVVLVSLFAHNIHLDIDMVLLGDLIFVPFDTLVWIGIDWGPRGVWFGTVLLLINLGLLLFFLPSLYVVSFDRLYAEVIGVRAWRISFFKLFFTTVNLMVAFEYVGIIGSIGMLIVPAATASLQARSIQELLRLAMAYSSVGILLGVFFGFVADISLAGGILLGQSFVFCVATIVNYSRYPLFILYK